MSAILRVLHPVDGVATDVPSLEPADGAERYLVGLYYVDALDGEPTEAEVMSIVEPPTPLAFQQVACAALTVDGWDVTGIERCLGISGAFVADTDTVWVFFAAEQPDTNYILMPPEGFTKFTDHVEVTRSGLSELSFLVFRVQ